MKSRWLAYLFLVVALSFVLACKGEGGGETDSEFLEVVGTGPADGAEDIQVDIAIGFRVGDPINPDTLTEETFFVTDPDGNVLPATVDVFNQDGQDPELTDTAGRLILDEPMEVLTDYTVTITTGLQSMGGKQLEEEFLWSFRTIDAAWGETEWIEPQGLGNSAGVAIGVADDLSAIAVWRFTEDGVGDSILANRYTRSELWGNAAPIESGAATLTEPQLAVDGAGNGFAVWTRIPSASPDRNIYTARYDAESGAWSAAELLQNGDVTRAREPSVAADPNGNAVAVWIQEDEVTGREVIRAIRYEPASGWGDSESIAAPETFTAAARTAVGIDDEGRAIAVWDPPTGVAGAGARLLMASRYQPGIGWLEPVSVKSDETSSADNFALDVGANGDAFLVWEQNDGGEESPRDDVWASRFSGGTWGDPVRIDDYDDGDKSVPDVAVDGSGAAYVVWAQSDPDFVNIWGARYVDAWANPELVEPPNEDPSLDSDAETPKVEVNRGGNAFAVWRQEADQQNSIWSNRIDPGTGWLTAEVVEDVPGNANRPTVVVDEGRHAHAVWQHSVSGGGISIRTNRFE
ncbi:MAG: Ig-like domain-containing protein [Myxococcota bacterium]